MDGIREFLGSPWVELVQWSIAVLALLLAAVRLIHDVWARRTDRREALKSRAEIYVSRGSIRVVFDPLATGAHHTARLKVVKGDVRLASNDELVYSDKGFNGRLLALPEGHESLTIDLGRKFRVGSGPEHGLIGNAIAVGGTGIVRVGICWHGKCRFSERVDIVSPMLPPSA